MRFIKFLAGAGLVSLLVACGGGGSVGGGGSSPGTGSTSTAASITLTSSAANISTAAGATNATVTITAEVRNSSGTGVSNEPITFTADSGALTNASTSTGTGAATGVSLGRATALLSAGTDKSPRDITVTVTVGSVTSKIVVPVISSASSIEVLSSAVSLPSGSDASVTITALVKNSANNGIAAEPIRFSADSGVLQNAASVTGANGTATVLLSVGANKAQRDITVTATAGAISKTVVVPVSGTTVSVAGSSSMLLGETNNYTVSVKDSNGAAVGNVEVTLASSRGNTISPAKATTGSNGTTTFAYKAVNGGSDILTATGAGVSSQQTVLVNSENFAFTVVAGGPVSTAGNQALTVKYMRNSAPVQGELVYFSSTRGIVSPTSGVTNAAGEVSVVASSSTAGPATISAQLASTKTVTTSIVNYFAAEPNTITLQANAAAIPPNAAGTSTSTAVLTAIVRDESGNPVQGATVNFTLVADTSGGTLTPGTAVTNADGRVTASFIPGATTTGQNGVVIMATTKKANGSLVSPIKPAYVTVSTRALFITISTSNTISNRPNDDTVYMKPFSVLVNDAAGAPVVGQSVSLMVWPTRYAKGVMDKDPAFLTPFWKKVVAATCDNEDINRNGFLDPGEDGNNDLVLQPGNPGTLAPATVTTDSTGYATFNLYYGEQYALWTEFEITAGATVAGTESRTVTQPFWAPAMLSDSTSEATPAGYVSPFGTAASCLSPR